MKFKNNNILCFGEVLWDRLPSGEKPGGAPMNVALHLTAAGLNVSLASKIGADKQGNRLIEFLQKSGLNTDLIQVDNSLPTSEVLVHLDDEQNATYEICEPVAWDNIVFNNALKNIAQNSGLLVYGSLASRSMTTRKTLFRLMDSDVVKLMDINLRKPYDKPDVVKPLLEKTDILKLNDDELKIICSWKNFVVRDEKAMVKWLADQYNLKMLCVTRGKNGAILFSDNTFYDHPGYKVKTIDTVGAGDAFLSGLIAALLSSQDLQAALELACATGAFVASRAGATPKYDIHEINSIIKKGL
jgi:fructokinase